MSPEIDKMSNGFSRNYHRNGAFCELRSNLEAVEGEKGGGSKFPMPMTSNHTTLCNATSVGQVSCDVLGQCSYLVYVFPSNVHELIAVWS